MPVSATLQAIPLFAELPEKQRRNLADIAVSRNYAKGDIIFAENDRANGFYAIVAGRIKIYKLSPEGKEQILHVFGPGDVFGEVVVFAGRKFPAYAEPLETATTLFFPRDAFINLIRNDPDLALGMLAELSIKLRQFTALIENLSLKEVPARLAAHLLYLSKRQENTDALVLELPKSQLASLLGTIPETLSRILARMAKEGLIDMPDTRKIRILDRAALIEISQGERRLT